MGVAQRRDRERMRAMARAIAGRLLHEPTLRLKRSSGEDDSYVYVSALRELFGLDAESAPAGGCRRRGATPAGRKGPQAPGELSDPLKLGTRGSRAGPRPGASWSPTRSAAPRSSPSSRRIGELGDKERFVRGVERAVLDGEVDLGVHSAKDLPSERPEAIRLVGVLGREEPVDAFVGSGASLGELAAGSRIGTASLRRRSQLLALRPDLEPVELRGNVDTRLRKLAEGEYDGIMLAAAGLRRLGREAEVTFRFGLEELTPAGGQGSLALEARRERRAGRRGGGPHLESRRAGRADRRARRVDRPRCKL